MSFWNEVGKWLKDNGPKIALGVGLAAGAAGTVVAIKETYEHLDPILEKHNGKMDDIHKAIESGTLVTEDGEIVEYTDKAKTHDIVKTYAHTTGELLKVYWPTLLLETLSAGCFIYCYGEMEHRNKDLTAAYGTLATAFAAYRNRVVKEYGADADAKLMTVGKKEIITEEGEIVEEDEMDILDDNCKIFCFETAPNTFRNDPYANRIKITEAEKYLNHELRLYGFITANDFYKAIGLPQTVSGQKRIKIFDNNDQNRDHQFVVRLIRDGRYLTWSEYLDMGVPEVILEINCNQSLNDLKRSRKIALR